MSETRSSRASMCNSEAMPTMQPDDAALATAAAVVVERLAVRAGEVLLVVYNPELTAMAEPVIAAARARTPAVRRCEFPALSRDGEEPPAAVAAAMSAAQAIVLLTSFSLSHTEARVAATARGARVASLPNLTPAVFARALAVDYAQLVRVGAALAARLTSADQCRVIAAGGTDLELSLRGRVALADDGDLRAQGAFGNLPAGEAYIAPVETSAQGRVVFDGSLGTLGLLPEPLTIDVVAGRVVAARGGAAASWLLHALDAGGDGGRTIAEVGIGTNPQATISGNMLEDEKAEGTVHLAFGTNTSMGGANHAAVHIDGLIRDGTVELDSRRVLGDGRLNLED